MFCAGSQYTARVFAGRPPANPRLSWSTVGAPHLGVAMVMFHPAAANIWCAGEFLGPKPVGRLVPSLSVRRTGGRDHDQYSRSLSIS